MTNKSDDNKLSFWQFIKTLPIIIKEHPWEFIKEFLIERLRHAAIHAVGAAIGLIGMAVLFFWAVISSDTDSAPSGCSNTEVEKAYFRRIDENKIVSDLQNTTLFVTGGYANLEEKTIYCDVTIKSRSLQLKGKPNGLKLTFKLEPSKGSPYVTLKEGDKTVPSGSAYDQGLADRTDWEQWFAGLSGDIQRGAYWWSGQRSLPNPGGCNGPVATSQQFVSGCEAAKNRLTTTDTKRKSDPEYRRGWNDY